MSENNLEVVTSEGEVYENPEMSTSNVVLSEEFNSALDAKIAKLKSKDKQIGISLTPRYYEFESVGQKVQGIFLGFKKIHKKEEGGSKEIACAAWVDENKTVFINGGVAFVQSFEQLAIGQAFEAELIEKKKVNQGTVKLYEIRPIF